MNDLIKSAENILEVKKEDIEGFLENGFLNEVIDHILEQNDIIEKLLAHIKNPLQPIDAVPLPLNVRQVLIFSKEEGFSVAEIHSDGLNALNRTWKKKKASHWTHLPKIPDGV